MPSPHVECDYIERFAREVYWRTYANDDRRFKRVADFIRWVHEELGDRPSMDYHLYLTDYPEKPACWVEVTNEYNCCLIRKYY